MRTFIQTAALIGVMLGSADAFAAIKVVTTTQDLESIVREVGGDKVTVESLAKGYQDPHFVEAKPSFILKLHTADLLVVGRARAGDRLAAAAHHPEPQREDPARERRAISTRRMTAKILDIPTGQITRAMGDVHPQGNPHYWLDPANGRRIAQAVQDKLSRAEPRRRRVLRAALRRLRPAARARRRSAGRRRWRPTRD